MDAYDPIFEPTADATPEHARGGEGRGAAGEVVAVTVGVATADDLRALADWLDARLPMLHRDGITVAAYDQNQPQRLRALADQLAAQSQAAGGGAPTDAEWKAVLDDFGNAEFACGAWTEGEVDSFQDHLDHAKRERQRVLALRDRERDAQARALAAAQRAITKACEIIELGDQRLLASDGDAGGRPPDLSLSEWRRLYTTLDAARRAAAGKS